MNSKSIASTVAATLLALSSFGATAAFADTFEVIKPNTMTSTTRAAVMADAAKARAAGNVQVSSEIGEFNSVAKPMASNITRADVRSEAMLASRTQSKFNSDGYTTY